jgi:hypothetical protein
VKEAAEIGINRASASRLFCSNSASCFRNSVTMFTRSAVVMEFPTRYQKSMCLLVRYKVNCAGFFPVGGAGKNGGEMSWEGLSPKKEHFRRE